ncbi:MAG: TMEM175 family protein [Gaiellaceae bacterium]
MGETETGRLEAFSDGVFAIAITLLIIEVHVPSHSHGETLGHALLRLWPSYLGYLTSFLTIGVMWINHHHVFSLIARVDRTMLLLNTLLLMLIAFVPFPTAVLAQFIETDGARPAAVLYGATLTLTAITFFAWWRYASTERRLIAAEVRNEDIDDITRAYTPGTLLYAGAMAMAFASAWASATLYLAIAVFYALPLAQWRTRLSRASR